MTAIISRVLAALSAAVFIAVWGGAAQADDDLITAFDRIVLGSEVKSITRDPIVTKWTMPDVRVSLVAFKSKAGEPRPAPVPLTGAAHVWRHLGTLEGLTGLSFSEAGPANGAPGLTVVFAPAKLLARVPLPGVPEKLQRELAGPAGCYFVILADKGVIRRTYVVVNQDRYDAEQNHCLLEELTQSLGLPNDSDEFRPSIFSDHDRLYTLGPRDRALVELLYHPEMTVGLPRREALAKARRIHQARRWNFPVK